MTEDMKKIAEDLAINAIASGFECLGDLFDKDDHGHLSDDEWCQVCDMAEDLKATVKVPDSVRIQWLNAFVDIHAEAQAERRAFGY